MVKKFLCFGLLLLALPFAVQASQSWYPARLDDPAAVYLTKDNFPVHADGIADDSAAIQAAIDKVEDEHGEGISSCRKGSTASLAPSTYGPACASLAMAPRGLNFCSPTTRPDIKHNIGYMFFFTGGRPGGRHWHWHEPNEAARPPFAGTVPPTNSSCRREPGHFLFRDEQRRFRSWQRQSRRRCDPVPCRAALLS